MKKALIVLFAAAALYGADSSADVTKEILALERKAMDAWARGDADAVLAMADPNITYFHSVTEKRLDGIAAVKELYQAYRGRPLFDSYEIIDPKVQASGDTAILTYLFVSRNGSMTTRWNATQVYQHQKQGWRVIHTHFALNKPPLPGQ